ncbi:MAG: thioredoxin domain-containing protein [Candidatus Peribacteraceae bacterium]|nr:thioredoxin domain-containing protein [Candidatus Peribacteraceae bacterium]
MSNGTQQDNKLWFGIAMVLVGFIAGFALAKMINMPIPSGAANLPTVQQPTPNQPAEDPKPAFADIEPINVKTDHIRGPVSAPVAIIQYSDLECPFCSRAHPTMQQLLEAYPGQVKWVFRHFPLSFHASAQKAAEATECAADQGGDDKFWAMVDIIFEKGADTTQLATYAKDLGLNVTTFTTCLDSGKFADKISGMMQGGSKAGIRGTPGHIIVNVKNKKVELVSGAQPLANFKTAIDAVLK